MDRRGALSKGSLAEAPKKRRSFPKKRISSTWYDFIAAEDIKLGAATVTKPFGMGEAVAQAERWHFGPPLQGNWR
jgi:hypothetical protein